MVIQSKIYDFATSSDHVDTLPTGVCAGPVPLWILQKMGSALPTGFNCHKLSFAEKLHICNVAVKTFKDIDRDLDMLELFAGAHVVCDYLAKQEWAVLAMDIAYHHSQDATHIIGMVHIVVMLMRVKAEGVILSSPCCKPWLWLSRCTMGRHLSVWGDESRLDVRQSNETALFCAFLYQLAFERS
eukprot:10048558-Karenia_brevis.AAC.1